MTRKHLSNHSSNLSSSDTSQAIPQSFLTKKRKILSEISPKARSQSYTDNSPKGTIDEPILDLIDRINEFEGWVTTSSCSGRVSVFVEGRKGRSDGGEAEVRENQSGEYDQTDDHNAHEDGVIDSEDRCKTNDINDDRAVQKAEISSHEHNHGDLASTEPGNFTDTATSRTKASIGGKGDGNRWLFVSHEPGPICYAASHWADAGAVYGLLGFGHDARFIRGLGYPIGENARLIKLNYSPLILHVFCARLRDAKPLLAAAVNSGFRESGVHSLKVLDDDECGVMVGIRTAGVGFETVVGYVKEDGDGGEAYLPCVDEGFLRMCSGVIVERAAENERRKERFMKEVDRIIEQAKSSVEKWEDKDARRQRKRAEGLKVKQQLERGGEVGSDERRMAQEAVLDDQLMLK